jgi:hypothetical protein
MNAIPTSICRDDLAWTPFPLTTLEVFRPPAASVGQVADIIPFPQVTPADCPWPAARDSELSLPQIDPCEPCTVVNDSAGMTSATERFEEARITAQIQHESRYSSTYRMDSPSFHRPVFVTVMSAFHKLTNSDPPLEFRQSTAVLHGGHLMHHFGIWILALLPIQLLSAWEIGTVAGQTLGTGRYFHSATWLVLMLAFNLRVWFRYYGRESEAFHVPGICLFLSAILPAFLLQLLAVLQP